MITIQPIRPARRRSVIPSVLTLSLLPILAAYGPPVNVLQRELSPESHERLEETFNRAVNEIANGRYQDGRELLRGLMVPFTWLPSRSFSAHVSPPREKAFCSTNGIRSIWLKY